VAKIIFGELPGSVCGYYDNATGAIHIDGSLNRQTVHNTYRHELIHKILGHGPAQSLAHHIAREVAVDRITARELVTLPALMDAMVTYPCQKTRADALGVSESIYAARIFALEPDEQTIIDVCVRRCIGLKLAPMVAVREALLVA
jgi:hypothetical protein